MPIKIELSPDSSSQNRIDYLKMILEMDSKRLELIDSHRNRNLAHALITFAAAFGATLKFLPEANPYLVTVSLFCLAVCFFLRDCQLHMYQHGWNGTIRQHLVSLARVINRPDTKVVSYSYRKVAEREALRCKEWVSFNRWVYYLLFLGSIGAGVVVGNGWIRNV